MTVIAATAAVSPVSPAPAVGGKDVAEGFDAMLAVATAGEAPVTSVLPGQSKAQADSRAQDAAASDEDAEQGLAAGQADAAALAAATLVAAMALPTQPTFAAAPQVEAEAAPAGVATLVAGSAFPVLTAAAADPAQDASAVDVAPDLAVTPPVAAQAKPVELPVTAAAPVPAEPRPIADPKVVAPQPVLADAGLDLPPEAVLTTPVAAADLGLDAVAVAQATAAQTTTPQTTTAQANATQAATTFAAPTIATAAPVSAAPVDAPLAPVVAAPVAEAPAPTPTVQAAVQVSVQTATEPAIKVATATVPTVEVETAAPSEESPVKIAGVAVSGVANPSGGNPSGAGLGDTGQDAQGQGQGHSAADTVVDAGGVIGAEVVETADAPTLTPASTSAAPLTAEAQALAPGRAETRGSPETVAQLSAEILKKLDAQTTRFDVALTPDGLGTVDVRIEIGRNGDLTAAMHFDTAQAAAELRGKAQELRQALSQAGFTVADNALRFDVSSQGGQGGQNGFFNFNGGDDGRRAWSGKAFQAAQTDDAPILSLSDLLPGLRMAPDSGLDIRI